MTIGQYILSAILLNIGAVCWFVYIAAEPRFLRTVAIALSLEFIVIGSIAALIWGMT